MRYAAVPPGPTPLTSFSASHHAANSRSGRREVCMPVQPGSVVRFRYREWVVLPSGDDELVLRPLTGTTEDAVPVHRQLADLLAYSLPSERIEPARFPLPDPAQLADAEAVRLLGQATRLLLREGAAPFRSLGRISVRPRPYQLVPLLMALRLDPVRLLIADDVGVGKTIEAGLIARELWDSGAIRRLVVLCPPPLTDQWATELREKFNLEPVVVGPATLAALERTLPPGRSVYRHYPVIVASIDFLKLPRNREPFLAEAPDLVIVDEAHGVVPATPAERDPRHLRYQLVAELARDARRHLILLTATPHSGIQRAFQRLLGLLDRDFEQWNLDQLERDQRERLARHLVQRTRADIRQQWQEPVQLYPQRQAQETTYQLSAAYKALFQDTFAFCRELVERSRTLPDRQRRFQWWAALTLLRCVMSSPRAGAQALERRELPSEEESELSVLTEEAEADGTEPAELFGLEPSEQSPLDEVPAHRLTLATDRTLPLAEKDRRRLRDLAVRARAIEQDPAHDSKLQACLATVRQLLAGGSAPVVWCVFVETAEYVAERLDAALRPDFPDLEVACLTGRIGEEERRERVRQLSQAPWRLLVATDCLSEGVNLQEAFDAVLHYDLPWNPNRLEQREGRVDRFGQPKPVVTAVRLYGRDNPVDAEVIDILIRKADRIRRQLGVHVPVPEDEGWLAELLVHRLFVQPRQAQLALPFGPDPSEALLRRWDEDAERERIRRTRFAQHTLDPQAVLRELETCDAVLGDERAVHDFVAAAAQRLGAHAQPAGDGTLVLSGLATLPDPVCQALPRAVREKDRWRIAFRFPHPSGIEWVGRNHPFVAALARYLLELAFERLDAASIVARVGVVRTSLVRTVTTLALLRVRFRLLQPERPEAVLEDVLVTGCDLFAERWLDPAEARRLLDEARPEAEIPLGERRELATEALAPWRDLLAQPEPTGPLGEQLRARADELVAAHRRVREAAKAPRRGLTIDPHWPPDLVAVLVLQPRR